MSVHIPLLSIYEKLILSSVIYNDADFRTLKSAVAIVPRARVYRAKKRKKERKKRMGHKYIYNPYQSNSGIQYESLLCQHNIRAREREREITVS